MYQAISAAGPSGERTSVIGAPDRSATWTAIGCVLRQLTVSGHSTGAAACKRRSAVGAMPPTMFWLASMKHRQVPSLSSPSMSASITSRYGSRRRSWASSMITASKRLGQWIRGAPPAPAPGGIPEEITLIDIGQLRTAARVIHKLVHQRVKGPHGDGGDIGQGACDVSRQVTAEAEVQNALALPGQAPCLFGGYERLAGTGASPGDNAGVSAQPGEKLILLVGEPYQFAVGSLGAGAQ